MREDGPPPAGSRGMSAPAAIVGAFEHPTRLAPDSTALQLLAESARGAVADAGLRPSDIDGLCTAGDTMATVHVAEYLGIHPRWLDSTSIGGSSFLSHVAHASDAIARGHARAVLIAYGSTARSYRAPLGTQGRGQSAGDPMGVDDAEAYLTPYGVVLAAQYALVASRHMHEYGTTREQLAEIAVSCREHAGLNPRARYRDPISIEDVISSPAIATPLHRLDCCVVTDGGGAVVVADPALARDCAKPPVWVLGGAEAVAHGDGGERRLADTAASQSGPLALERAGRSVDDVDLCMIYDSFTITVLTALEGLGFCAPGDGGAFVADGRLRLGGALPLNPDGGALSNHHPGRRGIFLAIEAALQLRGEAGERQVAGARTALCHGVGGFLGGRHSGSTLILGADE